MFGFKVKERMRGSHRFAVDVPTTGARAGEEHPLEFEARWGHRRLASYLSPWSQDFLSAALEGWITAGGLCQEAPIQGNLELRYHKDATIRYRFGFTAAGRALEFEGEKRGIRPWNLHRTHTTCYGRITDPGSGELLSTAVVHFALADLPRLVTSLRLG